MSEKHAGWAREREELFGRVALRPGRGGRAWQTAPFGRRRLGRGTCQRRRYPPTALLASTPTSWFLPKRLQRLPGCTTPTASCRCVPPSESYAARAAPWPSDCHLPHHL